MNATVQRIVSTLRSHSGIGSGEDAAQVVERLFQPVAPVTFATLFAEVGDAADEYEDACEICGVRCSSTMHAPYPGLCVRCTAKVQMLQKEKRPGGEGA
jgi:hypothetical protein